MKGQIQIRFLVPVLLVVCSQFTCKLDINQPIEAPLVSWDEDLNTHPRSAEFQQLLDDYVRKGLPGVVMFVKSPVGIWNGASGYAKIETKERMTPSHLHYSNSMGKTYTGSAIMLLVEDGVIELDAKINEYLPRDICDKIGNGNEATVRQLLNHTSGIRDAFDEMTLRLDLFNGFDRSIPPEKQLEYIHGIEPYFPAGRGTEYSNTNFLLVAMIMDHVLAEGHAKFISERIIDYLELKNTYYKNEPEYPKPPGLVNSYSDFFGNGNLENWSEEQNAAHEKIIIGYAGFIASSADYMRFLEGLLGGELVSQDLLNVMLEGLYTQKYGLGLGFYERRYNNRWGRAIGHTGDFIGSNGLMLKYLDEDTYLVILANVGFLGKVGDLYDEFWDAIEDMLFE